MNIQKTTKIASLTALIALTGALSYGAASNPNPKTPIGSLALLYESVAGEVSDFADVTPSILASLRRKDLLQLALIGGEEPERFPNLYQDAMSELYRQKERFQQLLQQHNGDAQATLFDAAKTVYETFAAQLLAAGANVNIKNNDGETALMLAAIYGHRAVAIVLIDAGANIDAKNKNGYTALMLAVGHGHRAVAKLLIGAGANITGLEPKLEAMDTELVCR